MPLTSNTSGLTRTNPQAHETANGLQVVGTQKIGGGTFAPTYTWAITSAGVTTTMTPTLGFNAAGLRYFKWRIIDESGNSAFGAATIGAATAVAITTSGLNPLNTWRIEFSAETKVNGFTDRVSWWLEIPEGAAKFNPSGSGQLV